MQNAVTQDRRLRAETRLRWEVWPRWVLANASGEALGLGATAALGFVLFPGIESSTDPGSLLMLMAVMVAGGAFIEGVAVGTAQWFVLRGYLRSLTWKLWVGATALGAGVAWLLGMLPSTVISLSADASGASGAPSPGEMSDMMQYGLAAVLGLVLGPVLGVPQWLVLRRHLRGAGWWVAANSLAWAFGMVVIFMVAGSVPTGIPVIGIGVIVLLVLGAAGAIVGAVHGIALAWLLGRDENKPAGITER